VVFEDDQILVIDKPTGLLTAAAPGEEIDNAFGFVKSYIREQVRRRGTRVWIVHRLDREASGLLVFAKTEQAFEWLKEELRTKRAHRLYLAVVEGEMHPAGTQPKAGLPGERSIQQPLSGTIQSFLREDERGLMRSVKSPVSPRQSTAAPGNDDDEPRQAKLAVTHYRVLAVGKGRTLLQVRLETGRKNQIRVHMQEAKHPIVGDRRYGAQTDPLGRLCLHAIELGFAHPVGGETVRFRSAAPGPFWNLVGQDKADVVAGEAQTVVPTRAPTPLAQPHAATRPPKPQAPNPTRPAAGSQGPDSTMSSWDHVADWYTDLLDDRRSDHHDRVILPGTMRLLEVRPGMRVLDVACGQGILCERLAAQGASPVGVDSSPKLISTAQQHAAAAGHGTRPEYHLADARTLGDLSIGEFDAAACMMALMNMDPLGPLLRGIATRLKAGGRFVAVMLHPAFRAPGQSAWGWEGPGGTTTRDGPPGRKPSPSKDHRAPPPPSIQYRRIDGYLSLGQRAIVMNPGAVAKGGKSVTTVTYHRPIQAYVKAFADAGLLIDALEEWPSLRQSEPGPRAAAENRARREIPMFLALRAIKPG